MNIFNKVQLNKTIILFYKFLNVTQRLWFSITSIYQTRFYLDPTMKANVEVQVQRTFHLRYQTETVALIHCKHMFLYINKLLCLCYIPGNQ